MMEDTRYGIQDTGYRIHDGYKMHGTRVPVSCTLHRVSCIILLLFASCILHPASAQLYPVQSTLQITPPYSLTLADYVAPGSEKVALNIFLADVNRPELSVRLRLRIEGVGIRIETKAEYLPEPMMISGGVPLRLIGADLVDYFDPRNLNFSGITQREYEQKAALPEGLYQFTFEVIEYNRGVKISNSATVMAWLILNDPPLINLPKDNDKIRIQSPQQVIFQWTPRHTGSPNSAFSTEYEFLLVEVWPSTRNPNDAILTSPAIFETTTAASTLIYGPAETPLEPGRRYAFRIKAKSIVGVDELNLFKNNGYSQVSTFVYGDACTLPTGIQAEVISSSKIGFAWDTQDNHTGYNIKYRLANTPNAAWYTNTSALNDIEINSLQPATTYEYQVAAACGSYDSEYSPVATVTTNEAQTITYSCGLPLNPFDLDLSQLIESLKTGDVIQAGDFDVKLTEVSGSNGIFTGKGVIEVPFFNKARLQASFSGISVNKELRMVAGSMNITGGGVEVIPAGVMDMMDELTEALALADSALNLVESNLPQPFDPHSFVADKEVKIPGTITSVTKGANGGVVVTASNGTEQTIPAGGTTAITDSNGNGYLIDSKGNIHPTTAAIASAAAHREYNLNVNFAKATDTRFGFDAKKHDALLTTYEHVKDTYYASWKSIATGQTDNALALLEGTNVDKTKIHFEQSGQAVTANTQSPSPNTQVLNIKGIADGVQESVVALYTPADTTKKEQVLGKLNVVTYNQIDKHVVIVPVNGNTFDKFGSVAILQDSLNKIYNQGIVNWTVELKAGITVEGISPFEDGGTGLLSNFTSHMKKVINAYKENTTPDTYYLFLVSNPQDPSTLGVMPRSKEYGFIFADKHSTLPEVARTIAHELGHGAFNLHHTFMEPNYTITKGTTDNLMDYPAGPKLYKYQWDKIRYPDIVVGIFESDDEGQSKDELIAFFDEMAPYLKEKEYSDFLKKIKVIVDFFKSCENSGWASYDENGIVPYCFWKGQDAIIKYTILDLPFTSGVVDGAYSEVNGLFQLSEMINSLNENYKNLVYAYTIAYWKCRNSQRIVNGLEYMYVIERLAEEEVEEDGVWKWLKSKYNGYESEKNEIEQYFKECYRSDDIRESVEEIYQVAINLQEDEFKTLYEQAYQRINDYFKTLSIADNLGRYERGRLIVPAVTLIVPVIGATTKIARVKSVLKAIKEATAESWDNILRKLASLSGRLFTVDELMLLRRSDLPEFVRQNLIDLLKPANRNVIWDLTDETAGQFKRGDLIEEIFNQWNNKYRGYQNLNEIIPNYKDLDFDGVLNNLSEVVSLKTYHPTSSTQKTLEGITSKISGYAKKLSTATINSSHAGKIRVLDFTLKKDEWINEMDDILDHIDDLRTTYPNVTIRITEF